MQQTKKILLLVIASYAIVLLVNISGNWQYYSAGHSWHFSVLFTLAMTTICWIAFLSLTRVFRKIFQGPGRPTIKILVGALIFAATGVAITILVMKSMAWLFSFPEQGISEYINTSTYAALFSMAIGLMVSGQQMLLHLKKSVEENEHMKQEMIRSQYESLKNQVNPHFLFNALNTLTVMIPEQPTLAVSFVEQMAKVFRYSLQHSDENTIELATELKVANSYIFLNQHRFGDKLKTNINIDSSVMADRIITHSLLILIENAIKHNELSYEHPLLLEIFDEGNFLVVKNNLQLKTLPESSTGVGLENIRKRYALASEMPVAIESSNNSFIVKIPLLKK